MKISQFLVKKVLGLNIKLSARYFNYYNFNKSLFITNKKYFSNQNISEKESLELVEAGVFEILKSAAKCKIDKLNRSATLEELGFDSLDQVELIVAMEEKFGINIPDEETLKIQSVLDAIQVMHSHFLKDKVNVGTQIKESNEEKNLK